VAEAVAPAPVVCTAPGSAHGSWAEADFNPARRRDGVSCPAAANPWTWTIEEPQGGRTFIPRLPGVETVHPRG
jgi:hypothetical protein